MFTKKARKVKLASKSKSQTSVASSRKSTASSRGGSSSSSTPEDSETTLPTDVSQTSSGQPVVFSDIFEAGTRAASEEDREEVQRRRRKRILVIVSYMLLAVAAVVVTWFLFSFFFGGAAVDHGKMTDNSQERRKIDVAELARLEANREQSWWAHEELGVYFPNRIDAGRADGLLKLLVENPVNAEGKPSEDGVVELLVENPVKVIPEAVQVTTTRTTTTTEMLLTVNDKNVEGGEEEYLDSDSEYDVLEEEEEEEVPVISPQSNLPVLRGIDNKPTKGPSPSPPPPKPVGKNHSSERGRLGDRFSPLKRPSSRRQFKSGIGQESSFIPGDVDRSLGTGRRGFSRSYKLRLANRELVRPKYHSNEPAADKSNQIPKSRGRRRSGSLYPKPPQFYP